MFDIHALRDERRHGSPIFRRDHLHHQIGPVHDPVKFLDNPLCIGGELRRRSMLTKLSASPLAS